MGDADSLGNPDAPVVIQGWEDFRCPACSQWTRTIKPQLMANYIQPDGVDGSVRSEYHYFPLTSHGETAFLAAQAAECAADQGGFGSTTIALSSTPPTKPGRPASRWIGCSLTPTR
ncbi:MAG: thioredoxin domain-containing protein [Caldilineaceae bacterium]